MKKFLLTIFFLSFISFLNAQSLSGTYYIGNPGTAPGGSQPNYTSLKNACDAINSANITGNCTFYFTSDLTEGSRIVLGVNTNGHTITFKPYSTLTSCTINFTQLTNPASTAWYGYWVIGTASQNIGTYDGLVKTKNIIIDGSVTPGGSTRDLTFISATQSASSGLYPFRIASDVQNCIIKNCNITTGYAGGSSNYGIRISGTYENNTTYQPDSIMIDNCLITCNAGNACQGIAVDQSVYGPNKFPNVTIQNSKIVARTRGIFLGDAGNINIMNNEIILNQTNTGNLSHGIWGLTIGDTTNVINIYNNKISMLATKNSTANYGIVGIEPGSKGTYNIYNNFIYGFSDSTVASNPNTQIYGIWCRTAGVNANIYFNSIYMNDIVLTSGTGVQQYNGIYMTNGNNVVKNNIIYNANTHFPSYCIYRGGTSGSLVSNFNDFYASDTSSNVGYWNATKLKSLSNWRDSSHCDSNSVNVDPGFVSLTDLHLAANTSPVIGKGSPVSWITKDFDGELRDTPPELGADEIPGVVPVELTSFTANLVENKVSLSWSTATETNNSRFEIEKKTGNTDWTNIGSLAGNGTSTKVHSYTFVDSKVDFVKATYRIKQIDLNGSYSYSKEVEVNAATPVKFELNQNYPNPFNPVTIISYSIPFSSHVRLEVYSITGQRVKLLVDETQSAGLHNMRFDGSSLASGVYIYRLTTGEFVVSKKMQLLK